MRGAALLLVAGFGLGCWRGSEPAPITPVEPEPAPRHVPTSSRGMSCGSVATNVHVIIRAADDPMLVRRADALREAVERRCAADAWSEDLRRCLGTASAISETDTCEELATPAQRQALDDELESIEGTD